MKRSILISLIIVLMGLQATAQNSKRIKVEGVARIKEVPEQIIVSIDLTVKDSLYQVCFNNSMEALNTLKAHFKRNGINPENIKSRDLVVNENFEWQQNKRIRKGYISTMHLEVKDKYTAKISEKLLNSLDQKDLDLNYRISFGFTDEQKTKLRKEALELAIMDAAEKAETIANASGLKLDGIANITYASNATFYEPMDIMYENEVADMAPMKSSRYSGINLNPKEQKIQKSVLIEWAFTN